MSEYKIYVPLMNGNTDKNNRGIYLRMLKEAGAERVFIACERQSFFLKDKSGYLNSLKENIAFFKSNGFETGVWISSLGYGEGAGGSGNAGYTKIRSVTGKECEDAYCPSDRRFTQDFCAWVKQIASLSPDMIMLDDEFCLSVRPGLGCFCDTHLKMYKKRFNRSFTAEELKTLIFTGGAGVYRDAYIETGAATLKDFCRKLRQSLDEVNPSVRMGVCAGFTSWDIEGADTAELAKILAGGTKPFLRFTGAPYWVAKDIRRFGGQRLSTVIECVRMQENWCRGSGIEVFNEADSYPRPRYHVPASLIECFDAALRASGGMSTLKYMLDYVSGPFYETGYLKRHIRNKPLYEFIDRHFGGKQAAGVKVFEEMRKFRQTELGEEFTGEREIMTAFFSPAAAMLTSHAIPVTYGDGGETGVAFGENARYITEFPKKLIIDIAAAKILMQRNIDTGILSFENAPVPSREKFGGETVDVVLNTFGSFYKCTLKPEAEVKSVFVKEEEMYPAAFTYNNGLFEALVYAFDAYSVTQSSAVFISYCRQKQLIDFTGNYPRITGNPGVYQIFKRGENSAALLFENICEDEMFDFEIELDREYKGMELYGAQGRLDGKKIIITSAVPPYGIFAVNLEG